MRCGLRAGWRDGSERLCQETDESSTRYSRRHTSSESGVSAHRPRQSHGDALAPDRSVSLSAKPFCKASLRQWARHGCPAPIGPRRNRHRLNPPDQRAQFRGDLRSASKRAGFPTPVPTEASSMPTHEGLGPDNRDGLEDRWKPSIQQDQEQAISVRELGTTAHPPCSTIS